MGFPSRALLGADWDTQANQVGNGGSMKDTSKPKELCTDHEYFNHGPCLMCLYHDSKQAIENILKTNDVHFLKSPKRVHAPEDGPLIGPTPQLDRVEAKLDIIIRYMANNEDDVHLRHAMKRAIDDPQATMSHKT